MSQLQRPVSLRVPGSKLLFGCAVTVLATGLVAGCGGSKAASSASDSTSAAPASAGGGGAGAGGAAGTGAQNRGPAAYGVAAAISGNSIEVQDPATGQVTVTFTAKTTFSQTKTVTGAAVTVGACVTAVGARSTTSSAPSAAPSGQAAAAAPQQFTATSVSITPAVSGSCQAAGGFGGGFGGGTRPSGAPTGARPSGSTDSGTRNGGFGGTGGIASGKVTALSPTSMSVQVLDRRTNATVTDTVTLTAATTYSQTAPASSTALQVGKCVTATGPANSTGAVAATRIALSTAGPNGCTTGFGGRRANPSGSASPTGA